MGMLYGVQLPENFNRPYLQSSIAAFWQSWHMTLSDWVRFYVFSPLSRWLLSRRSRPPMAAYFADHAICDHGHHRPVAWHRRTLFVWGLWHGLGLYHSQALERPHPQMVSRVEAAAAPLRRLDCLQRAADLSFRAAGLGLVCAARPEYGTETSSGDFRSMNRILRDSRSVQGSHAFCAAQSGIRLAQSLATRWAS